MDGSSLSVWQHGFAYPLAFALLGCFPIWAMLAWLGARRRKRALIRFGARPAFAASTVWGQGLRWMRGSWLGSGLLLLVAGIAGPRWGRDWEQSAAPGRDLVVILDLSRSMLAQDVLPNRAERAKQALADLSRAVQQRGGHRLGLVTFAARARLVCPLTHDYEHFRTALSELDAAHPHPDIRPSGKETESGTRIGAGLRLAVEAHDPRFPGAQDILLISDGDDPAHDGEWREGAEDARQHKIPVHTIGIGNPLAASPIPVRANELLRHQNEVVQTRLEEQPLLTIARWTGGTYTPARTDELHLGQLFHDRIEPGGVHEEKDESLPVYRQRYAWFYAPALVFLTLEMIVGSYWQRRGTQPRRLAA